MTLPFIYMLTGSAILLALFVESVWHGCTYRN